jgi:hypothetical protein
MQFVEKMVMFVCLKPNEQFFSYLVAVTIAGDMAVTWLQI